MTLTFNPDHYAVAGLDHAMRATVGTLGFSDGSAVRDEDRWEWDTPMTTALILRELRTRRGDRVVDYGCGTGRISKELIRCLSCAVTGVDASASMRRVAAEHVASALFTVLPPEMLLASGERHDAAVCLWVLQHSLTPWDDAARLHAALKPGGALLVLNEEARFLPTVERGFVHDGVDVRAVLAGVFGAPEREGRLDPAIVPAEFAARSFWAVYRRA